MWSLRQRLSTRALCQLMARLAKSDTGLFRTLGEQNASVRQMVDDLTVPTAAGAGGSADQSQPATLQPQSLLPPQDCALPAPKARFRLVVEAQAWAEERLGPAPRKPTWAVVEQAFRTGAWPMQPSKRSSSSAARHEAQPEEHLLQRMDRLEQQLIERLDALEPLIRSLLRGLRIGAGQPARCRSWSCCARTGPVVSAPHWPGWCVCRRNGGLLPVTKDRRPEPPTNLQAPRHPAHAPGPTTRALNITRATT